MHPLAQYQILDVRKKVSFERQRVGNSIHVDVNHLNDNKSIKSSLLSTKLVLQKQLRSFGVNNSKKTLILGRGIYSWGEDGRLFWILSNYTKSQVYLYHGSYDQFIIDFPNSITTKVDSLIAGNIQLNKVWYPLSYKHIEAHSGIILDVRSSAEYLGATPFSSKRGGRIPSAVSFPWSDFFGPKGFINRKHKTKVVKVLQGKGQMPIVYCTAGYRSALIYAVLKEWGIDSLNYDGSWYEYSAKRFE
ncbi:hypothetical protein MJH12_15470 [bacterium]|nr:hypothetical protein [bacterium]